MSDAAKGLADLLDQRAARPIDPRHEFRCVGGDELRRGTRSGGPDIGDEVHDRHVRLMADCADHRYPRGRDGPREPLVVEAPQIPSEPPPRATMTTSTRSETTASARRKLT